MVSANQNSLNACSRQELILQSCRPAGRWVKPSNPLARSGARGASGLGAVWSSYVLLAVLAMPTQAWGVDTAAVRGTASVPVDASLRARRDPVSCQTVRFSDVGWTDVTATTALVAQLLRSIGYSPTVTVLSVPVTFASIQNNDIDVFLGNWMPAQEADRGRYVEDGSVVVIGPNLTGAKYTLAVPAYTYAAGLKDFSDIQHFAAALNDSIYGIEPGNDGNRHVLEMLKQNQFGLGGFKLVESSEQGMLAQV